MGGAALAVVFISLLLCRFAVLVTVMVGAFVSECVTAPHVYMPGEFVGHVIVM